MGFSWNITSETDSVKRLFSSINKLLKSERLYLAFALQNSRISMLKRRFPAAGSSYGAISEGCSLYFHGFRWKYCQKYSIRCVSDDNRIVCQPITSLYCKIQEKPKEFDLALFEDRVFPRHQRLSVFIRLQDGDLWVSRKHMVVVFRLITSRKGIRHLLLTL